MPFGPIELDYCGKHLIIFVALKNSLNAGISHYYPFSIVFRLIYINTFYTLHKMFYFYHFNNNMSMKKILLGVLTVISLNSQAQNIYLKNNTLTPVKNIESLHSLSVFTNHQYNAKTYCIIQFSKTIGLKDRLKIAQATGIEFFDYIPQFAFIAAVPNSLDASTLANYNVRDILPYESAYKIAKNLTELPLPSWIIKESNKVELEVEIHHNIAQAAAEQLFASNSIEFKSWRSSNRAIIQIPTNAIGNVANLAWVKYIQATSAPAILENLKERNNHRVNTIDNAYFTGLHYDGTGVSVSEGDDGKISRHIDFTGRLINHSTDTNGTHGDHVGGIIAGGGNFDPTTSGNARGADLHAYDYYANLFNASADYNAVGVRITTNSLGQSCNSGYDGDAQFADQLILSKPSLLSVHSSGNSGGGSCGGVANGFYTITGGYKSGKNVISVGNVDNSDVIAPSSSKGPSEDGRIKPEIVAVGTDVYSTQPNNTYASFTGTSMACPAVAGTLASLYQAYRETHANADPRSDVMKAVLMNTADDLGNKGPDYTYGYGRVNARKAFNVLNSNQFIIDSTETFNTNEHYVTVPIGTKQLKVMLYWHDLEGNTASAIPLVNNLDLRMKDDNSVIYNPWILNTSTNPAFLDLPATRGTDIFNNVEQITIDSVAPGDYAILITGQDVPFGPQTYIITYEFIPEDLTLTYPNGGEAFANNVTERIRWDAYGNNLGNFILEYSSDAGTNWNTISSTIADDVRYYDWTPPSGLNTGQMMMRISRGSLSDMTDTMFTTIDVPTNLVVDTACDNRFHLSWDAVTDADGYKVYSLGAKYMEEIATSTTNEIYLNTGVNLIDTFYFAVAATNSANGAIGRRTIVYVKLPGEVNCVDDIDNVATILPFDEAYNCAVSNAMPIRVKLKNIGLKDVANFPISYQINANPVVTENVSTIIPIGDSIIYTFGTLANFSLINTYNVKTWTHIWTDTHLINDTSSSVGTVILPVVANLPAVEDFEAPVFPPNGWRVFDNDTNVKWQKTICFSGATIGNTHAAYMDFFNYGNKNAIDELETYQLNLVNIALDSVIMTFDRSAAYNSLNQDTLSIWVSTDCGKTYQPTSYSKWGTNLATVGSKSNIFSPTLVSHWINDQVDLSSYIGQKIFVRFRGVNRNGNNVYLDNINVIAKNETPLGINTLEANGLSIFPNPSADGLFNLSISNQLGKNVSYRILNMAGQIIQEKSINVTSNRTNIMIDLAAVKSGVYMIELNNNGKIFNQKLTKY
jgi:hypothetical protein